MSRVQNVVSSGAQCPREHSSECRVRSVVPKYRVHSAECRVCSVYRVHIAGSRVQSVFQSAESVPEQSSAQSAEYRHWTLDSALCTLPHSGNCTLHSDTLVHSLHSAFSALWTLHSAFCTLDSGNTGHWGTLHSGTDSTLCTLSALWALGHSALCTMHSAICTLAHTLHSLLWCTLWTLCTLHSGTLYILHSTLWYTGPPSALCTPSGCTLYSVCWTLIQTLHSALYTLHSALTHSALHDTHWDTLCSVQCAECRVHSVYQCTRVQSAVCRMQCAESV